MHVFVIVYFVVAFVIANRKKMEKKNSTYGCFPVVSNSYLVYALATPNDGYWLTT